MHSMYLRYLSNSLTSIDRKSLGKKKSSFDEIVEAGAIEFFLGHETFFLDQDIIDE